MPERANWKWKRSAYANMFAMKPLMLGYQPPGVVSADA
jgi:hypothetical protein